MKKIAIFGSSGKMGRSLCESLVEEQNKKKWQCFLEVGKSDSGLFDLSVPSLSNIEEDVLFDVDVWIDFSSAVGLSELIKATSQMRTAIVSGSTGLSEKEFSNLKKESKKRPLFWSSNMSPGLWAFRQAMKSFSFISEFDFAIDEIHHNQKKDSPSGTALTLHKDLQKIVDKSIEKPTARRIGGVFGVHTVYAASNSEVIQFQHQALNRKVFSQGALEAAKWLTNKKAGLYSMDDLFLTK